MKKTMLIALVALMLIQPVFIGASTPGRLQQSESIKDNEQKKGWDSLGFRTKLIIALIAGTALIIITIWAIGRIINTLCDPIIIDLGFPG